VIDAEPRHLRPQLPHYVVGDVRTEIGREKRILEVVPRVGVDRRPAEHAPQRTPRGPRLRTLSHHPILPRPQGQEPGSGSARASTPPPPRQAPCSPHPGPGTPPKSEPVPRAPPPTPPECS